MLANLVPKERLDAFVAHLENENEFKRPHRVPTLSADHPAYRADGGYWCGGVWAPTTYMVLKGLRKNGYDNLAYDIACNHLENVVSVFRQTGTLWEIMLLKQQRMVRRPKTILWDGRDLRQLLF